MLIKTYTFPINENVLNYVEKGSIFYDIETTGFHRDKTILYMIGSGYYEGNSYHIIQWFNEDAVSEESILEAFGSFIKKHGNTLISFNGDSFDLPYLRHHLALNEMEDYLREVKSLDLYKMMRPYQSLFGLEHGRQKDWEKFLGICREDLYDGGQLIKVYKEYLKTKDNDLLDTLLLHNMEDLRGMDVLLELMAYKKLEQMQFDPVSIEASGQHFSIGKGSIIITCPLDFSLPADLMLYSQIGSVEIRNNRHDKTKESTDVNTITNVPHTKKKNDPKAVFQITIPYVEDTLMHYYKDYKNYYYLPGEDRAVHKSIGVYVEQEYRVKAKAETCYIKETGIFLPLPSRQKYGGFYIDPSSYLSDITMFKNSYSQKISFAELDCLLNEKESITSQYIRDYMLTIFIRKMS